MIKIKDVLAEMRDAREIYERCRSGGADCDCIDVFHALRIYADLIEKSVEESTENVRNAIKMIRENSIRRVIGSYPQIEDSGIITVCDKALKEFE